MKIIVDEEGETLYLDKYKLVQRIIAGELRHTLYDKQRDDSIIELCMDTLRDLEGE